MNGVIHAQVETVDAKSHRKSPCAVGVLAHSWIRVIHRDKVRRAEADSAVRCCKRSPVAIGNRRRQGVPGAVRGV